MYTTYKMPPGVYSKTYANKVSASSELTASNSRIRNHNRNRRNNQTVNRALANFTGGVPSVGTVFVTVYEHIIMKYQFNTFQDKLKRYVLLEFENPGYIIVIVWYVKDPYAHVDMNKLIKYSKETVSSRS